MVYSRIMWPKSIQSSRPWTIGVKQISGASFFPIPGLALGVYPHPGCLQTQFDLHVHEHFSELVFVLEGTGEHIISGHSYPVSPGDVFLVWGDLPHCYSGNALKLVNILFNWEALGLTELDLGESPAWQTLFVIDPASTAADRFNQRFRLLPEDFQRILQLTGQLEDLLHAKPSPPGVRFLARSCFQTILSELLSAYSRTTDAVVTRQPRHKLGELAAMLERDYARPITLREMCGKAGMSSATLFRHFRRFYHDTPVNYLIRQRLTHAAELLRNASGLTIGDIAFQCGFRDSAYFTLKFKELYHETPLHYRRRNAASGGWRGTED